MAGGHHLHNNYLSPSGGWFFIPKNWRANTVLVSVGLAAAVYLTYTLGERHTVVSNTEYDDATVARWNAAAKKSRSQAAVAKTE